VGLSNGRELGITRWHPVFTNKGWCCAGSLAKRSRLFSEQGMSDLQEGIQAKSDLLREEVERAVILFPVMRSSSFRLVEQRGVFSRHQGMLGVWEGVWPVVVREGYTGREELGQAALLLAILREEARQSGEPVIGASGFVESDEGQASGETGWERACFAGGAGAVAGDVGIGMGSGIGGADEDEEREWLSDLLQERYWQARVEVRERSGRQR